MEIGLEAFVLPPEKYRAMRELSKQGRCSMCGSANYYDVCDRGPPVPEYPEGLLFCANCHDSISESYNVELSAYAVF